jgi:uncharacterized protein YndB with AHSA1/START domain
MEMDMDAAHETHTDLDATPDEVWDALTDPDGAASWLGDGTLLEPVEGGRIETPDPESGIPRSGRVDRAVPGRRLAYTWWPTDPESPVPASTVEIELVPNGASTRLVVVERPLTAARGLHADASVRTSWAWRLAAVEVGIWCRSTATLGARH